MSDIFISYRREDSEDSARALYESLIPRFGKDRVFMDVDSIDLGTDFRKALERRLSTSGIFLVIIGPQWLGVKDPNDASGRRRLDDPNDFVRQEVASGLKKGDNLPVIPVLVRNASLPRVDQLPEDLKDPAFRSALVLSHLDWEGNVQRLVNSIQLRLDGSSSVQRATSFPSTGDSRPFQPQVSQTPRSDDRLLARLDDQIMWYEAKGSRFERTYKRIKVTVITAACLIAVLAALHVADTHAYLNTVFAIATALLCVLIAILEGVLETNQYQQIGITYRTTCEALKREKYTYLAKAGVYATTADPYALLVERIEGIAAQENTKWASLQQPQKGAKPGEPAQ